MSLDSAEIESAMVRAKERLNEAIDVYKKEVADAYGDPVPLVKDWVLITGSVVFAKGEKLSAAEFYEKNEQDNWVTQGLLYNVLDMMRFFTYNELESQAHELEEDEDDE